MRCLLLFSFSIFSSDSTLCSDAGESLATGMILNNREKQEKTPKTKHQFSSIFS